MVYVILFYVYVKKQSPAQAHKLKDKVREYSHPRVWTHPYTKRMYTHSQYTQTQGRQFNYPLITRMQKTVDASPAVCLLSNHYLAEL